MAKILKCNVCGKNEMMTNISFSSGPLLLRTKAYDGQPIRVFVYIGMEYENDYYDTLRDLGIGKFYDIDDEVPVLFDSFNDEDIMENGRGNVKFDLALLDGEENIIICDQCKKMMSNRILRDAVFHKMAGSKKVNLEQESIILDDKLLEFAVKKNLITEEEMNQYKQINNLDNKDNNPPKRGRGRPKNKK